MKNGVQGLRDWIYRQNEALDIERFEIGVPLLPAVLDGYTFVVLSDLHFRRPKPYHDAILQAVHAMRPDCILIAGDTIDSGTERVAALESFLAALSRMAPVVAILGNNDCLRSRVFALRETYARTGVTLLENETRMINARGYPLQITGLLDPEASRRGVAPVRDQSARRNNVPLSKVLPPKGSFSGQEGIALPSFLLVHRPELAKQYAAMRPTLIIAGHAHGGQFRFQNVPGVFAPGQGFFPKLTSGLYDVGDSLLLVSRGLGNHELPLRLNNPPHLPIIALLRVDDR